MSRWKGKERATEADEGADVSREGQVKPNGRNESVRMAATASMLTAAFRTEPAKQSLRPQKTLRSFQPVPVPLASASSTSSAAHQPPRKRARRVLATEEEMDEWRMEGGDAKAGGAAVKSEPGEEAKAATGTKQEKRASENTAREPPDPRPHPRPIPVAPPRNFHPLTAFGLSPSLASVSSEPASKSKGPSRPAPLPAASKPVSALSRLRLPLPARPKTPITESPKPAKPLAQLSSLLPAPTTPSTPKDKEKKPILSLAPPASVLGAEGEEKEGEGDDEWSPRKKGRSKGYIHSGIAARASALLASSRTDHTLWLHSMSRLLSPSLTVRELRERMRPDVRLKVVEVLDPYSSPSSSLTTAGAGMREMGKGGGRKTLLTRCRLILDTDDVREDEGGPRRRDLEGLVFFSLHFSSSSASTSSSSSSSTAPTFRNKLTVATNSEEEGRGEKVSLVVPQNPYDLYRFIAGGGAGAGREVWVWEPWGEVGLAADPREFRIGRCGAGREEEDEGAEGVRVEWGRGGGAGRDGEKEGGRKGLVCSRFAVVLT